MAIIKSQKYNPRQSGSTTEDKFCLFVKLLIYESVIFFELEDFVCMFAEISGDLQGYDSRRHIAAGLDEIDGLS